MRGALLLLTLTSSPVLSFLWGGQVVPSWRYLNLPLGSPTSPGWRGVWREEVGGLVAEAPPQRMMVDWSNKVRVFHPNTTTSSPMAAAVTTHQRHGCRGHRKSLDNAAGGRRSDRGAEGRGTRGQRAR